MQHIAAGKAKSVELTAAFHAQEQAARVADRIKYFQGLADAFYATNTSGQQRDTALHALVHDPEVKRVEHGPRPPNQALALLKLIGDAW